MSLQMRVDNPPLETILARIESLVTGGQALAALDYGLAMHRQHRQDPDARLEERLVRLRHEAYAGVDQSAAREDWPPEIEDYFPGQKGLVTITPAELTTESLTSALRHHGALIVRGLVSPASAERMVRDMDAAFDAFDQWRNGAPVSTLLPWLVPFDAGDKNSELAKLRAFARQGGAVLTADSPRMLSEVLEQYTEAGLIRLIGNYLGERPVVSARKSLMRRVPPDLGSADWHQDGAFLDLGQGLRTVNVWLSLSECGAQAPAPGMELVSGRLDRIVRTGTDGACFDWTVGPEVVRELSTVHPVVKPRFEPGDVLLFDEYSLHRTATGPGYTRARYALETWFFAPSHYPAHHVPLVA